MMMWRLSKIFFLGILIFLTRLPLLAQPEPLKNEKYDLVEQGVNRLEFYGDSARFKNFYSKLDTLFFTGKGKINVVHIGGSHIQADMWSDQVRLHLQKVMPAVNGGRGFLFPYRMARTNNPSGYQVEYTGDWKACRNVLRDTSCVLGLSGISVTTTDSLSSVNISFKDNEIRNYYFNRVRIFHPADSSFIVHLPKHKVVRTRRDEKGGYTEFSLASPSDTLYAEFVKTDSLQKRFTLYGIDLGTDEPGIIYNAIGVNGAAVPSYNRSQLFQKHLTVIKPDLVILSIGINDAHGPDFSAHKYERDYDTLVASILAANPNAAILFTTNNDSYYKRRYANKNAFEVRNTMKKLSAKYDAAVWDMFGLMGGIGSIRTWEYKGYAKRDRIHLTREGYQLMGDLLFNAILKSYGDYLADN